MSSIPQVGDVVDGFRIDEQIHSGGMGVVYAVSGGPDPALPMIMKVPFLGPGEPAISLIGFEQEQMILAALKGPHVPRFVAAGDLGVQPYIVMERVVGTSLKEQVGRGPLPVAEVVRVGTALAAAIHSLHLQDTIHLDVKPSNVMFRPGGEAVLIDFGLAHHAHYPDLVSEEFRRPIGSAPYIAPEQVIGFRRDPRSDIFSLGVVLYELATGRLPFGSPGRRGLKKRLYRDPEPPRAIVQDLPEWLQEVILRCLEPDADARPTSAASVAFDLAHPEQVALTERARRTRRAGPFAVFVRYLRAAGYEPSAPPMPSARVSDASIVLVAIATVHQDQAQLDALRDAVRQLLATREHTRVACVEVIRRSPELGGSREDDTATSQRIKHVVLLRHWAEPLALTPGQVSFHVVESSDPAGALLDFARANHVDHIVVGAPPRDFPLKSVLGTVSTKVAAEAPCTVTMVRPRAAT